MFKQTLAFICCLYLCLAGLSAIVFHLPWRVVGLFPEPKRDLMISLGIVSAKVHPLYRDWLMGFVRQPNAPRTSDYIMDTYQAYGDIIHTTLDDAPSDAMGWPNTRAPGEANVLFVGDSFANGASVGTRLSPPALYEKFTGAKVYNASSGGYGLGQYVRIADRLLRSGPAGERFRGKDVVVLVYLGNDLDLDMAVYRKRLHYSQNTFSWLFALGPLRAWTGQLLENLRVSPAHAAARGLYCPIPMACETVQGLPFALHPAFSNLLERTMFTDQIPEIKRLAAALRSYASDGVSIKIVLIPQAMQVVGESIDWGQVPAQSRLASDMPGIVATLELIRQTGKDIFQEAGFEVLDLTDTLRAEPQRCLLYQPADTHCTALGYETIARAIARTWPHLGGDRPD